MAKDQLQHDLIHQGDHFFKSIEFYEIQKEWDFPTEKDKEPIKDGLKKLVGVSIIDEGEDSQRSQTAAEK